MSDAHCAAVDSIKIGQRFINNLLTSSRDTTIVTAILNLGDTLGLTVVAEGVETHERLVRLRDLGCDRAQGFHLARPAPPDDLDLTSGLTMPRAQSAATAGLRATR